jgi:DnaJ-domain-containing protein 1
MSIGRRLIDLARAELNSLLERAANSDEDDHGYDRSRGSGGGDPASMSDRELEEEIERRHKARAEAEAAARGGSRASAPPRSSGSARSSAPPPRRTAAGDDAIRKAYASLEIPPGSDFETVRRSYRQLMRKYHPDLHTGRPEKQRAATDLTQRLTEAYKILEKHLRR